MTEAENPLEQMTVQERLNLSKEHYKAGAFDKAIDVLRTRKPTRQLKIISVSFTGTRAR